MLRERSIGVLEYWSIFSHFLVFPQLHFSVSPFLRFSVSPSLQIKVSITFLIIFGCFATVGHAFSLNGPWDWNTPRQVFQTQAGESSDPLRSMVELHRKYISPIDGKNCPMYPSCSRYSLQCLEKHGFFIGWVMTFDRLLRCGRDELRLSPEIVVNDELLCYDPLENNDFWWWNKQ
jgi:putative membrane protein insertion efficiency factor